MRSEVRDEVALELAEQMTAATAASSVETAEKEIQTDPISLGPPEQTQEAVPVAPPPPTAPAVPHETSAAHQELTDADHELLRTCLEEIRNLTSLLSNHAGIPTVVQHKDVRNSVLSAIPSSQMNAFTCGVCHNRTTSCCS